MITGLFCTLLYISLPRMMTSAGWEETHTPGVWEYVQNRGYITEQRVRVVVRLQVDGDVCRVRVSPALPEPTYT